MYYPINKEDRATGFLIPIYGTSTIRGQIAQQRVLLGDQPQPGRDVLPRLATRRPARASAASTATCAAPASAGNAELRRPRRARGGLRAGGRHESGHPAIAQLSSSAALAQALPATLRRPANANYFSSLGRAAAVPAGLYSATNRTRSYRRQSDRQLGRYSLSATVDRTRPSTNDD